jgi:transcriptional/translational regulatory protein YebC/TACO1
MTDKRSRTVAEVRHAFAKQGGNLGQAGSVAFLFKHCGQFLFAPGGPENQILEVALEAGAEDVSTDPEGGIEVVSAPEDYARVRLAFDAAGLKAEVDGLIMKALNETELRGDDATRMQKLIDALESLDDVQEVYTNAVFDEAQVLP